MSCLLAALAVVHWLMRTGLLAALGVHWWLMRKGLPAALVVLHWLAWTGQLLQTGAEVVTYVLHEFYTPNKKKYGIGTS